jgi:hypothetical protein
MKFSIPDLMFVTVIVALAVAWWVEHSRVQSAQRETDRRDEFWEGDRRQLLNCLNAQLRSEGLLIGVRLNMGPNDDCPYEVKTIPTKGSILPDSSAPAPNQPEP